MQLIVHVGMFKTGTTSIQQALHRDQEAFLAEGLYYPRMPPAPAHHLLTALYQEQIKPDILAHFDNDRGRMAARARAALDELKRDVARRKPAKLVLSSELFLEHPGPERFRRFRALLDEFGAPISVCCYVRAPAPFYVSSLQQETKTRGVVLTPRPMAIRRVVEALEQALDGPVTLRAYDPARFAGGDVVRDFVTEVVGCSLPAGFTGGPRVNESLSAESMSISVSSRRANFAGSEGVLTGAHRVVLNTLRDLERVVGGSPKPRLRPEVAAAVTRASVDLLWLRDARGVVFDDVDYGAVDGRMPEAMAELREIEQICEVDAERRELLLMRLLAAGVEARLELARLERLLPVRRILAGKARLKTVVGGLRRASRA